MNIQIFLVPPLFNQLWTLYEQHGDKLFKAGINKLWEAVELNIEDKTEVWAMFIRAMTVLTKKKFQNLIPHDAQKRRQENEKLIRVDPSPFLGEFELEEIQSLDSNKL